jgi:hypothetical protein
LGEQRSVPFPSRLERMPFMSNSTPALTLGVARRRRAASLRQTVNSKLLAVWRALEQFGKRRAASEFLLTADRIQGSRPELAANLRAMAREARTL